MSTYIDGIGASENIDSSGEVVSMAGLDISTLDKDGLLSYEHELSKVPDKDGKMIDLQVKVPAQVVGKILKAKKIFSDKDCDDDRQLYYWNRIKTPYLYVMGELFDDYTDSARHLAGKFRYDADHKDQKFNVTGFSVEGATVKKEGMMVLKSIARKITLTTLPCNKSAITEMIPAEGKKKKDDLSNIFKTEVDIGIELLTLNQSDKLLAMLKAEDPNKHADILGIKPMRKDDGLSLGSGSNDMGGVGPSSPSLSGSEKPMKKDESKLTPALPSGTGTKIGATQSGKDVMSHQRVGDYQGFSPQDHRDAAGFHQKMAEAAKDPKSAKHHADKSFIHTGAANTLANKLANRVPKSTKRPALPTSNPAAAGGYKQTFHPRISGKIKPPGPLKKDEPKMTTGGGSTKIEPQKASSGTTSERRTTVMATGGANVSMSSGASGMMSKSDKEI